MASDKAKELAAKQKAAAKAEKLRRKNSDNPADWGQLRQIRETYKLTRQQNPRTPWLLLGAFLIPILVCLGLGLWLQSWLLWLLLGISLGLLAAMMVFVRLAKRAAYKRYEGQAGSAEIALSMLPKQWVSTPAITANRHLDVVHRTIGPGGLILVGEGEPGRLQQMLAAEVKRHEQVAYGVAVTTIIMGDRSGQIPLNKLTDHIRKMPKVLSPDKVTDVRSRLRALDSMRGRVPIPKGPMPSMKGARRAMRGR